MSARATSLLLVVASLSHAGCLSPECALGSYYSAECRVAAENHYAQLITSTGVQLRFHAPEAVGADVDGWEALGLFQEREDGVVQARPAGLADFALTLRGAPGVDRVVSLQLINVAPDTVVSVGPAGALAPSAGPALPRLSRELDVRLLEDQDVWVVGRRPCPDAFRLVAAGDVQTNPVQFERIVQDLHAEAALAEEEGQPLLGLLLLGDLAESATEDEFRRIREILASSPVPVATIPGNHDIVGEELAIYNRLFGPGNYAFDVCAAHVVLLDSANGDLAPSVEGRLPTLVDPGEARFLVGGTHYPAFPGRTGAGFADEAQAWYLLSELVRFGADALLTGHVHTWRAFDDVPVGDGTIDQIITGTAGASQGSGQPHFGVTRLGFGPRGLDVCFVEVAEPGRAPGDPGAGDGPLRRCPAR